MDKLAVSIIIPVYNSEKYLDACLKSVAKQSLREIEILCVDNASTDDSATIIKEYCSRDKRFLYIRNEYNRGQAYSRNVGLDKAKGTYVYFVDSDDMLRESALLNLYRYMEQDELDGILFDAEFIDEKGAVLSETKGIRRACTYPDVTDGKKIFSMLMKNGEYTGVVWRQIWRKAFLLSHHICFFEMGVPHEDVLFSLEVLMAAEKVKCVQDVCYRYRRHSESITASVTTERLVGMFVCFIEIMMHSKTWLKNADRQISISISMYLNSLRRGINRMINILRQRGILLDEINLRTEFYSMFFRLFIKQKDEILDNYLVDELIKRTPYCEKLIVYGCGVYGKQMMRRLDSLNVTDYIVAVSDTSGGIFENNVFQIDELQEYRAKSLVLIAVSEVHQMEIIENLKRLGFKKYLCVV